MLLVDYPIRSCFAQTGAATTVTRMFVVVSRTLFCHNRNCFINKICNVGKSIRRRERGRKVVNTRTTMRCCCLGNNSLFEEEACCAVSVSIAIIIVSTWWKRRRRK